MLPWNGQTDLARNTCQLSLNLKTAMITATPYFLSRLAESPLKSTFSSYLSITFTASSLLFLAHATATSKQVDDILDLHN